MASTYTTNYSLEKQAKGMTNWHTALNDNLDTIDTEIQTNRDHLSANGSSHSYIDQDVTSGSSPTFDGANFSGITMSKSITIESPDSSEDLGMFYTTSAITITKMVITLVGSSTPSVTVDIRHHTDRSNAGNALISSPTASTAAGNNAESTGHVITSFDDATVPAASHVWLETTAQSGTVTSMTVTIEYDED